MATGPTVMPNESTSLLFDADDTLWQNFLFFQKAINDWIQLLAESGIEENQARIYLEEAEHLGFRRSWYGSRRLELNMMKLARELLPAQKLDSAELTIREISAALRNHSIQLFPEVSHCIETLSKDKHLILVTMGQHQEQLRKLNDSGLSPYFDDIYVLPDKNRSAYERIIRDLRLSRRDSWMIGNSLTKDIRPAQAAGLRTCHFQGAQSFDFGRSNHGIEADIIAQSHRDIVRFFRSDHEHGNISG